MRAFEATFPTVTLRLYVEALGAVIQLVHSGMADIGISGVDATLPGIERLNLKIPPQAWTLTEDQVRDRSGV